MDKNSARWLIILVELEVFDEVNELDVIRRIRGVSGGFESTSPFFVIGFVEAEEKFVSFIIEQFAVCREALVWGGIFTKEIFVGIVGKVRAMPFFANPGEAFDTEVVVVIDGQSGFARITFEQALSEGNACRDTGFAHFPDSDGGIFSDISLFFSPFYLLILFGVTGFGEI